MGSLLFITKIAQNISFCPKKPTMSCVFGTELYYVIQGLLLYFVVKFKVSLKIHVREHDILLA